MKTHKQHKYSLMIAMLWLSLLSTTAQGTKEDYLQSEAFKEASKDKVYHGSFTPHWIGESNTFWYQILTGEGEKYYIVNSNKKQKKEAFSLSRLTEALSKSCQKTIEEKKEIIKNISFSEDLKTLTFVSEGFHWECKLPSYKLTKGKAYKAKSYKNWSMARRDELSNKPVESPDKQWTAYIENYNVCIKNIKDGSIKKITYDGGLGDFYSSYIHWSPDSKKLMTCKVRPVEKHLINYIESSPQGQIQPQYSSIEYYKPGDALPQFYPHIFNIEDHNYLLKCDSLIPNQYDIGQFAWRKDSRAFTFEYNQRGHQVYQVIEMHCQQRKTKVIIDERSESFIHYSGKRYRYDINDGKQIVWASERNGWNHLYLYNGENGKLISQITNGDWLVRKVVKVNEANRTILFAASGKENGDPYFVHYYRINFDGTNLTHLTPGHGNHKVSFSPDFKFFVDTWSRVDMPPTSVLRHSNNGKMVIPLEKADITALKAIGWKAPEVFVGKGRDGKTDIWGHILYPSNFDSTKTYPVIEYIYAGPHSSFVPKDFTPYFTRIQNQLTELGFIIVSIDGMGTSNRSKAFHDVCWKNLKDAGFPDRILWIKAAAQKHSYMDISQMGIYGMSAGGQSSTGAVLFHPEFYKVAASVCGCHDNRMDKIWWNEQWMGWPIGEQYAASSNVDNASRLQGDLFLIVGEMDQNVDPASTYQVVDALIKANKNFDLLTLPGMGHTWGGDYGKLRICNYFVEKIMHKEAPNMNIE